MPFNESEEGKTHSFGDGCIPSHEEPLKPCCICGSSNPNCCVPSRIVFNTKPMPEHLHKSNDVRDMCSDCTPLLKESGMPKKLIFKTDGKEIFPGLEPIPESVEEMIEEALIEVLTACCQECKENNNFNCGGCGGTGRPSNSYCYELARKALTTSYTAGRSSMKLDIEAVVPHMDEREINNHQSYNEGKYDFRSELLTNIEGIEV